MQPTHILPYWQTWAQGSGRGRQLLQFCDHDTADTRKMMIVRPEWVWHNGCAFIDMLVPATCQYAYQLLVQHHRAGSCLFLDISHQLQHKMLLTLLLQSASTFSQICLHQNDETAPSDTLSRTETDLESISCSSSSISSKQSQQMIIFRNSIRIPFLSGIKNRFDDKSVLAALNVLTPTNSQITVIHQQTMVTLT